MAQSGYLLKIAGVILIAAPG